jgi:hypothetical protein
MKVFLSYSSKDGKVFAEKLYEIMNKHGHDAFLVDHDTLSGEKLWNTISEECLNRDRSIFILTSSSVESKGQEQEYDLAVSFYKTRMALLSNKCCSDTIFAKYPYLKAFLAATFDELNSERDFAELAVNLVKLQDKENKVATKEFKDEDLPRPSQEGLDISEIENCIRNLSESFFAETVIPEICRTRSYDEKSGMRLTTIGFAHRLPIEWFKSNKGPIINDFLFRDLGRKIALGERAYLNEIVTKSTEIRNGKFSPKGILEAVACIHNSGFQADIIYPSMDCWMALHKWHNDAHVEYSNDPLRSHLNASLVFKETKLKILLPLGDVPRKTMVFSSKAITWIVKADPNHGAIFIVLGKDRLYPLRYVELIAGTRVNIEMHPIGFFILET